MARLFHDGFEYDSSTASMPWTVNGGGAATYQSGTVRSGSFAGQISALSSATRAGWLMQYLASPAVGPHYVRFYLNITTLPSAANTIFSFTNGAALSSTQGICLKLNSGGTLALFNATVSVGTSATVLSTNTWYMIEVKFDNSGGAGAGVAELRINGLVEVTNSALTISTNSESFMIGGNLKAEAQTTGKWFFDDAAVNDSTGGNQTSYPGEGHIIRLKPNAQGDNNQFVVQHGGTAGAANNYTRVNNGVIDGSTNYNGDLTSGHTDDFGVDDTPAALSSSVINVVTVDLLIASDGGGAPNIRPRIKKASGGTVTTGTAFTSSAALNLNRAAVPRTPTIVLYNDPDGNPWTKTTLDSAQAGYELTSTALSSNVRAVSVSIQVDYALTVTQTVAAPYETLKALAATASEPYEALRGLAATVSDPYEAKSGISATNAEPYESLGGIAATGSEPYEVLAALRATGATPYETLVALAKSGALPYSSLRGLAATASGAYESLLGLVAVAAAPYETLREIAALAVLPFDAAGGVGLTGSLPYSTLLALAATTGIPYETLAQIAVAASEPYEAGGGLRASGSFPYSALVALAAATGIPYETLAALDTLAALPYSTLAALAVRGENPYETTGGVAVAATNPYEALAGLARITELPYSALAALAAPGGLPYETLVGGVVQVVSFPYEAATGVALVAVLPYETTTGIPVTQVVVLPYETRSNIPGYTAGFTIPVADTSGRVIAAAKVEGDTLLVAFTDGDIRAVAESSGMTRPRFKTDGKPIV